MSLLDLVGPQLSRTAKKRGQELYESGEVQIFEATAENLEALVSSSAWVTLDRQEDAVHFFCGCHHYEERLTPCRHVWAALVAAHETGKILSWRFEGPVSLIAEDDWGGDIKDLIDWNLEPDALCDPAALRPDQPTAATEATPATKPKPASSSPTPPKPRPARPPAWKRHFNRVQEAFALRRRKEPEPWLPGREILYIVEMDSAHHVTLETAFREKKTDGSWSKPRPCCLSPLQVAALPDAQDRLILSQLAGAAQRFGYGDGYYTSSSRYRMPAVVEQKVFPALCESSRCFWRVAPGAEGLLPLLHWDDGDHWEFWVDVRPNAKGTHYIIRGALRRGGERMELSVPDAIFADGLLVRGETISRLDDSGAFAWLNHLRSEKTLTVPLEDKDAWLADLLRLPSLPRLDLPAELRFEEVTATPRPVIKVRAGTSSYRAPRLIGELLFSYEGNRIADKALGRGVLDPGRKRLILRDRALEWAAAEKLREVGFRFATADAYAQGEWEIAASRLPAAVRLLVGAGWEVEAEGKLFRRPGRFYFQISSGVDWFELHGACAFEDEEVPLPRVLEALRRGETSVQLGDGTFGILPEDWLRRYGLIAGLGTMEADHVRFAPSQAFLLDTLVASQPEVSYDRVFAQAREAIAQFDGIAPVDPPDDFVGELRSYQREGLGWLEFLSRVGFGGCLADDMGLGKTVQALALLASRRADPKGARAGEPLHRPSLLVMPRSLVFNWKREAARFTPGLRVLDYTTHDRAKSIEAFADYDVVLTTYGTLKRDIFHLKDAELDYAILDEAQAIKNPDTDAAKAARLIRARHRLALTGTPVENHLGELWSIFEFLNPGMLGSARWSPLTHVDWRAPDEEGRAQLARALRPLILRRTKAQVEKDLPPKQEETLSCELGPSERKLYDELREFYRRSLLSRVDRDGLGKTKFIILEGLLRLRQAACHPGLVDRSRVSEPSAKLELLLPRLSEVFEKGHKALVFSQFVSLLSIVRSRLDEAGVPYEYLDGQTRDRERPVLRFQNDAECKLFLISLKAGGFGLNLTAADYVFILDPWWNPAVEAQAIDRTHRIGQSRTVFAYRVIARDTVEEKVLELQKSKRELADAILNANQSLLRSLKREDLELLLS